MSTKTRTITRVRTEVTFDDGTTRMIELAAQPNAPIVGEWNIEAETVRRPDAAGIAWVHEFTGARNARISVAGPVARTETL